MIPRARMIFVSPSRACTNLNHKQILQFQARKFVSLVIGNLLFQCRKIRKNCPCCHQQLWDPVSTRMHCRNEPRAYLRLVAMTSRLLLQRTTGHYTMFQLVAVRTDMETTFAPLKVDSWRKAHPTILTPFNHSCCFSSLACFSAAGSFLTNELGSAEFSLVRSTLQLSML